MSDDNTEYYIWSVEDLENSEILDDEEYEEYYNYEGSIYQMPKENALKIDLNQNNVLLFYEITDYTGKNKLMIFYDDNTLETYEQNEESEYILCFKHKLELAKLISFSFDKDSLYLYEKENDNYQLIRFKYDWMEFFNIWKTAICYGKYIMNFSSNNILFYDEEALNHCREFYCETDYYHFNTKDAIRMLSDTRNFQSSLCEIIKSDDGSHNQYGLFSAGHDKLKSLDIQDITFSHNGKDMACIDESMSKICFYNENFKEIRRPLNFSKIIEIEATKIEIDYTGEFKSNQDSIRICERKQGYYYNSNLEKMAFVGIDRTSGSVIVINYDLKNEIQKINEITVIKLKEGNEDQVKKSKANEIRSYLKCKWQMSSNKHDIVFYMSNLHESRIVVWDCIWDNIKKIVDFDISLLSNNKNVVSMSKPSIISSEMIEEYEMPELWIKYNYEGFIMRNPIKKSFVTINSHTKQEIIDKLINENSKERDNEHGPFFIGNSMFFMGKKENNKVVYIGEVDNMNDNIDEEFQTKTHFYFPVFLNEFKNQPEYKEQLSFMCQNSRLGLTISYREGNEDNSQHYHYHTKMLLWNPSSLFTENISEYELIEKLKGSKIDVKDFDYVKKDSKLKENFMKGDRYDWLFLYSLYYRNEKFIKDLTSFANGEKFRLLLDFRSEGFVARSERDNEPYSNFLNIHIKCGDNLISKEIIDVMVKDMAHFSDICDTIALCKDELCTKFEDLYIELIKNISCHQKEFAIDISKKDSPYMALTSDSIDTPYWPRHLASLENNETINKAINSQAYKDIEDVIIEIDTDIYSMLYYHPELNDFREKMIEIKNKCDLNSDEKEEWDDTVENFALKYTGDNKSISSVLPWKNAVRIGETGLMHEIINKGMMWETLSSENIQMLIDYKWEEFGRNHLMFDLIIHILLLILFSLYCIMMGHLESNKAINILVQSFLLLLSWIISIYNFYREVIQFSWIIYYNNKENNGTENLMEMASKIAIEWLYSKWNVFELIMYVSIVFVIPIMQLVDFSQNKISDMNLQCMTSVTVILIWWKLLYYMFPFKKTGPQVNMIFQVIEDISVFLMIMFMILIGFGTMFYGLFIENRSEGKNENFDRYELSIVTTYAMMLGNFDQDVFMLSNPAVLITLLFMLYMFIMMVVMLNLLIALMGDSFDKIKLKEEVSFYVSRCLTLSDIENKLLKREQDKINEEQIKEYFHILKPFNKIEKDRIWTGRVEEIIRRVRSGVKEDISLLEKKVVDVVEEKVNDVDGKVNSMNEKLQEFEDKFESIEKTGQELRDFMLEILDRLPND